MSIKFLLLLPAMMAIALAQTPAPDPAILLAEIKQNGGNALFWTSYCWTDSNCSSIPSAVDAMEQVINLASQLQQIPLSPVDPEVPLAHAQLLAGAPWPDAYGLIASGAQITSIGYECGSPQAGSADCVFSAIVPVVEATCQSVTPESSQADAAPGR